MRLAAILACLLTACATVGGRHQYVAVDSEPRGVEVRDASEPEKVLGVTPFFLDVTRAQDQAWTLRAPNAPTLAHEVTCQYRWGTSLVGNLGPSMVGLAVNPVAGALLFGAANLTDFASGAAWDCPLRVVVPAPRPPEGTVAAQGLAKESCVTYAIAPPRHDDESISRLVAKRVQAELGRSRACVHFAEAAKVEQFFLQYGVAYDTDFDVARFDRDHLNELGARTGATALVATEVEEANGRLQVKLVSHDLFGLGATPLSPVSLDLPRQRAPERSIFEQTGRWMALLPNAFSFSYSQQNDRFDGTDTFRLVSNSSTSSLLPSLANWTIDYLSPPDEHGKWDLTMSFSPAVLFGFNQRHLELRPVTGGETRARDVSVLRTIVGYGPTVSLFTPLGAFSGSVSFGLGFSFDWDDQRDFEVDGGRYLNVGVAFTTFVSETVFLRAGVQFSSAADPLVKQEEYRLSLLSQTNLTLGYFLPGIRSFVRGQL